MFKARIPFLPYLYLQVKVCWVRMSILKQDLPGGTHLAVCGRLHPITVAEGLHKTAGSCSTSEGDQALLVAM